MAMDLDTAIGRLQRAVDMPLEGDTKQTDLFHSLGLRYRDRYLRDGTEADLDKAIQYLQKAVNLLPEDCSEWSAWLYDLGLGYQDLSQRRDIPANIDIAIRHLQDVVNLTPVDHPDRAKRLERLGIAYQQRYRRKGDAADLDAVFQCSQEALDLTPETEDSSNHTFRLGVLGRAYADRYVRKSSMADIETAIRLLQERQDRTPQNHPHRSWRLHGLGRAYRGLYVAKGNEADLHTAIRHFQEAIDLTSEDDPNWPSQLQGLGSGLLSRFHLTGVEMDLDMAIQYTQRALDTTSEDDSERADRLSALGLCYEARFLRKGIVSDLDTAIRCCQEALDSTPDDHRDRAEKLFNLGMGHHQRFGRDKIQADMDTAIRYFQEALDSTPTSHVARPERLHGLGLAYQSQKNLQAAIPKFQEAVDSTVKDDKDRANFLHSLAFAHQLRFTWYRDNEADLDLAIRYFHEALDKIPEYHIGRASKLLCLGLAYDARFLFKGDAADENRFKQVLEEALHHSPSSIVDRLRAAKCLLFPLVEQNQWSSAYEVASTGVSLLTQLAPRPLVTSDKQRLLDEFTELAPDAAAAALMLGKQPYEAMRLLEAGRGIITGSLNEIHTDLSDLIQQHPKIAEEYVRLRDQLSLPASEEGQLGLLTSTAKQVSQRYDAGQKLERMIQTIRSLPNFDRFLMAPSEDEFRGAAAAGPVVIINCSRHRCDALIITKNELKSVPLPQLKRRDMYSHVGFLKKPDSMDTSLLEWLWDTTAKPVLDALELTRTQDGSLPRIWWIPTGPLARFPIHAAGYHSHGSDTVLDRVISSYASSVKVLLQSRRVHSTKGIKMDSGKAVLVGMGETPGLSALPFVPLEIDQLERICGSMQLKVYKPRPYRGDVQAALNDCDIFHFAGHGETSRKSPSKSSLALCDGPLTVEELFDTSLHNRKPFLAYLSACGTGQVMNNRLIDEALHLIAAYQVSGFRHVIGTLWEVKDKSCVDVATMTYKWMQEQNMTDESVSEGLHHASVKLRESWISENTARSANRKATLPEKDGLIAAHSASQSQGAVREPRHVELHEDLPLYWVPYVHFGI